MAERCCRRKPAPAGEPPQERADDGGGLPCHVPAEWRPEYEAQLEAAQRFAEERSGEIKAVIWRGLGP